MTLFDKRCNCIGLSVIASLIIGIITAFLRITAVISVSQIFLAVLFGIAVIYLAILLAGALLGDRYIACAGSCHSLTALLTGILGTILTSVVLFAISFVATSVIGAIAEEN